MLKITFCYVSGAKLQLFVRITIEYLRVAEHAVLECLDDFLTAHARVYA